MRDVELARRRDLAVCLEMDAVPFKPRAYEKAPGAIESSTSFLAAPKGGRTHPERRARC